MPCLRCPHLHFAAILFGALAASRAQTAPGRFVILAGAVSTLWAQSPTPPPSGSFDHREAFRAASNGWQVAGELNGDPRRDAPFNLRAGTGLLVANSAATAAEPLITPTEFGDLELELEFLLGPKAEATVWLQGRYPLNLNTGSAGVAPLADATRAPGLWQRLRVEFRAPQFDSAGRKTAPARFVRVVLNSFPIHVNVAADTPAPGAILPNDAPTGALVLTATRGAVAIRGMKANPPSPAAAVAGPAAKAKGKQPAGKAAKQPANIISIPVDVSDTIVLQRGFVPYEPVKRLYAISVGHPAGVHYAYDLSTGALLRAWRGGFIDAGEMWEGRSANQWAKPTGPALTLNARPTVARIDGAGNSPWPTEPDPLSVSNGYAVERDGQPVFLSKFGTLSIRDRIAPADRRTLTRSLTFTGTIPTGPTTFVLLARAHRIAPQPNASGFVVGDRDYYLDLPNPLPAAPEIRSDGDFQLLVIPVTNAALSQPITYSLAW